MKTVPNGMVDGGENSVEVGTLGVSELTMEKDLDLAVFLITGRHELQEEALLSRKYDSTSNKPSGGFLCSFKPVPKIVERGCG